MSITQAKVETTLRYIRPDGQRFALTRHEIQFYDSVSERVIHSQLVCREVCGDGISDEELIHLLGWAASGYETYRKPAFVP